MAGNHLKDLAEVIDHLERGGHLIRVRSEVGLVHDLAGIARRLEGRPAAVLFENVKGTDAPVFIGLYWSREVLADLMGCEPVALSGVMAGHADNWRHAPVDPVVIDRAPVLEVSRREVDLGALPIPTHALKDGGPYFDAAVVIVRDPETGVRNASIQRFQVIDRDTLHVNIDAGRHLELYLQKAAAKGRNLAFTLNVGVGPGLHFAAATPSSAAPADKDELGIASEFEGAPLALARGRVLDVEMAANAMYALECEIVPGETGDEGPFAEVTGYYARREPRQVVHVRAIHHRAKPIFHSILSGVEVFNSIGLLGEANVLALLQQQVPGVRDVYFPHGGCGAFHAVVQIEAARGGWSKTAIMAAFAAFPMLKFVTVVDADVNIHDAADVEWAMATRLDPDSGIVKIEKAFGLALNPTFPDWMGTKVGFDATKPYPPTGDYERVAYKPMSLDDLDIVEPEIK